MGESMQSVYMPGRILERHVGGNTTYARQLAAGLRRRGVDVHSIPYSRKAPPLTIVSETFAGLRSLSGLIHYVADTGPIVKTRVPSVVTVHGVASRWISTARSRQQEAKWRWRVERAIACTERIITVSESSRRDISDVFGVDPETIDVIHHGVEVNADGQDGTPPVGFDKSRPFLLYVGNVEPRKNLVALVESMEDSRLADLHLVIAGRDAWNFQESARAMSKSSKVTRLGFVSEAEKTWLMRNALLFVFPSLYEGFGFPVLEAMAFGTPVLTSRRGSLAEVAGPAALIEDLEAEGIAEGIVMALSDESWLQAVPAEGVAWSRNFNWENSIDEHIKVYEELTSGRDRRKD